MGTHHGTTPQGKKKLVLFQRQHFASQQCQEWAIVPSVGASVQGTSGGLMERGKTRSARQKEGTSKLFPLKAVALKESPQRAVAIRGNRGSPSQVGSLSVVPPTTLARWWEAWGEALGISPSNAAQLDAHVRMIALRCLPLYASRRLLRRMTLRLDGKVVGRA